MEERYERFFEMANISTKKTGLDFIVWISPQSGKEKHAARIKIQVKGEFIPITISVNPEIKSDTKISAKKLNKVYDWIKLNREVLMKYWKGKGKIGIDEILNDLNKI